MEQRTSAEIQDPKDLVGRTLMGSYVVEEQVAKGGMAWIYRVRHSFLDQPLALKMLFSHLADDEIVRSRFVSEAKIQFRLKHPNIVQVTEILNENKMLGMFQEWIDAPISNNT